MTEKFPIRAQRFTAFLLWVFLLGISGQPSAKASEFLQSGVNFTLAGNRSAYKTSGLTSGDSDATNLYGDVKLGLVFSGFYIGGVYSSWDRTYTQGLNSTVGDRRISYGFGVGFHDSGFFVDLNYYLSSNWNNNSVLNYTGGSGYGVDLGYNVALDSTFFIGLLYSIKNFSYPVVLLPDGSTLTETNKYNEAYPMLQLGLQF